MTIRPALILGLAALATAAASPARADDAASLLAQAKAEHRKGLVAIRSLDARFRLERLRPDPAVVGEGVYLRTPAGVFIHIGRDGDTTTDILSRGDETRLVARQWAGADVVRTSPTRMAGALMIGLADVWQRLLLDDGFDGKRMAFDRLIEHANGPPRATRATVDVRPVVRVEFSVGKGGEERLRTFDLDPAAGWLVRKATLRAPGQTVQRSEAEVEEFHRAAAGVFVPVRCRARSYLADGSLESDWVYSLAAPVVNGPIAAERMALPPIPVGTVLFDRTRNSRYPIDANWGQIGEETQLGVAATDQPPTPDAPTPASPALVVMCSVALLVVVATTLGKVWRRRAAASAGRPVT